MIFLNFANPLSWKMREKYLELQIIFWGINTLFPAFVEEEERLYLEFRVGRTVPSQ
jgi:hypothetical protein